MYGVVGRSSTDVLTLSAIGLSTYRRVKFFFRTKLGTQLCQTQPRVLRDGESVRVIVVESLLSLTTMRRGVGVVELIVVVRIRDTRIKL